MKQVLYVEDSATSQLLMRKYLAGLCDLVITPSLQMALSLLGERNFDLIVTDFIFPEGDATDLIHHVRRGASATTLPIVVISSSLDAMLLTRMLKAGANEGRCKPLNTAEFRALITRMLHTPYVRSLEHALSGVCCFQWMSRGVAYQYCPELQLTVSGPTKEDASKQMLAAIQERVSARVEIGYTSHEGLITHVVQT